uniref:Uncharacterized protein n=1 Tax=Anguilla anguilla TaxID=7936 RepID=A0A0E9Q2F1_ANGAN
MFSDPVERKATTRGN